MNLIMKVIFTWIMPLIVLILFIYGILLVDRVSKMPRKKNITRVRKSRKRKQVCAVNIYDETTKAYLNSKLFKYNVAKTEDIEELKTIHINKTNYSLKLLNFLADESELIILINNKEEDKNSIIYKS